MIPPLVSEEIWNRAFKKLQSRSKKFGEDFKDKIMYQNKYSFSARIFCTNHGTVFYRRKLSRNSDEIVWCCSEYLGNGKCTCDTPRVRQSELYSIFDDIINNLAINLEDVKNMLFNLYKLNIKSINIQEQIKKEVHEKEKIIYKKDKLLELNMSGVLSNIEFKERNDKYNLQISKIDDKIIELIQFTKNFDDTFNENKKLEMILKQKIIANVVRNRLVELLLDRIIVSNVREIDNSIELKIFLNFSEEYIKNQMLSNITSNIDGSSCFFSKYYEFKRGFEKTRTKRYRVKYRVNCYGSF